MRGLLFILVACGFLAACDTGFDITTGQTTFYMEPAAGTWSLLIDTTNYGMIDERIDPPYCGWHSFINVTLPEGEHEYRLIRTDSIQNGNYIDFDVVAGNCQVLMVHK